MITIRNTRLDDIEQIIAVEVERYREKYTVNPELVEDFRRILSKRLSVAQPWMWVAEMNGVVVGSLSAQPTTGSVESFRSWEESTDNGTLENTYNESGSNVYVVSLDVLRIGTKAGAQYALMLELAAQCIATNKKMLYFESRMPEFRKFVRASIGMDDSQWSLLGSAEKMDIATKYAHSKTLRNGKEVPSDRLLRFYLDSGFKIERVVDDAYDDAESLNFGVVFTAKNRLPRIMKVSFVRRIVARLLRTAGHNRFLIRKITS